MDNNKEAKTDLEKISVDLLHLNINNIDSHNEINADDGKDDNSTDELIVATFDRFGWFLLHAELGVAKELFVEMTYTCARAFSEIHATALCFNEFWFDFVFKEKPVRMSSLTYSACQPLLSKYSDRFQKMMAHSRLKVLDVGNLNMLKISFEYDVFIKM